MIKGQHAKDLSGTPDFLARVKPQAIVCTALGYGSPAERLDTWAEECTDYPDGVREAALAHKYKSETTAAYQRGQKLEKRRVLMKDWAQFLVGSNVIHLGKVG